ncbi:PucR family transcriptional regulator [Streptomyces sp. HB2AG]|uniref:PucR family transcriptional regulator n=1 Tax=Streptomyces sp. HB2AG TaxID=2983400 RepID=UPI0022AA7902|nr:helix-turn-helix domain-containing protein [Streptomyces sp. HB2AG]MCZ2525227.1 helix-turn-helix domain-containing protein [Streptomyces sp. HB2AG]
MGRAEREAVCRDMLHAEPGLVARIVDEVRREVPAYRGLHGSRLAEVRAITRWASSRLLRMWAEDTGTTAADVERAREIGRARAADGRSVDAVVRAYRVGAAAADRIVAEHAGDRLSPGDVFALNRIWLRELETLTEALAAGHADAAERLDADRDRALRAFLDDLLVGRQASPAAVADRSRALGVCLPESGVLLVAGPARLAAGAPAAAAAPAPAPDRTPSAPDRASAAAPAAHSAAAATAAAGAELVAGLLRARPAGGADVLHTTRADHLVLLLDPGLAALVGPLLRGTARRGCLVAGHGPDELADAYRLARDALGAAPARAFDADGLLHTAEAHVVGLLNATPGATPATVRRHVLGPLLDPGNQHLAATLDAYLGTGSATAAAEALHLHPQTLRYRMRRVRELTGRDPRDPWQRLMLEIARTVHG